MSFRNLVESQLTPWIFGWDGGTADSDICTTKEFKSNPRLINDAEEVHVALGHHAFCLELVKAQEWELL